MEIKCKKKKMMQQVDSLEGEKKNLKDLCLFLFFVINPVFFSEYSLSKTGKKKSM